jgi:hypothetical protein
VWDDVPESEPLPVTATERMYITPDQAAELLVDALDFEPGRYAPRNPEWLHTADLAERLHPGRPTFSVPLRNGDRPVERLTNDYEVMVGGRIWDCWEREPTLELAA